MYKIKMSQQAKVNLLLNKEKKLNKFRVAQMHSVYKGQQCTVTCWAFTLTIRSLTASPRAAYHLQYGKCSVQTNHFLSFVPRFYRPFPVF